ncbi:hypothetical protein ACFV6I_38930, partial [Kitasatospora sp. NPDC059803]
GDNTRAVGHVLRDITAPPAPDQPPPHPAPGGPPEVVAAQVSAGDGAAPSGDGQRAAEGAAPSSGKDEAAARAEAEARSPKIRVGAGAGKVS